MSWKRTKASVLRGVRRHFYGAGSPIISRGSECKDLSSKVSVRPWKWKPRTKRSNWASYDTLSNFGANRIRWWWLGAKRWSCNLLRWYYWSNDSRPENFKEIFWGLWNSTCRMANRPVWSQSRNGQFASIGKLLKLKMKHLMNSCFFW